MPDTVRTLAVHLDKNRPGSDGSALPGLDGLRAVAVVLVLLYHQQLVGFGWAGVQIFFVLSGYLITKILHRTRSAPLSQYLRNFYGRRALRIFPLYYAYLLALGLAAAFGVAPPDLRSGLPFAVTYTYNFYHAGSGFVHSKLLTHLWSLSVEEQFYLVWPLFLYFLEPNKLRRVLWGLVLAGPLIRALLFQGLRLSGTSILSDTEIALYVCTPSHVDAFALGALASLFPFGTGRRALLVGLGLTLALGLLILVVYGPAGLRSSIGYPIGLKHGYAYIWGYSLINVSSVLLIECLVRGVFLPRFFEHPALAYLGRISYGVYVLHFPVQAMVERVLPASSVLVRMAVQLVCTLASASVSYHVFELRFLRLKDRWFGNEKPRSEREVFAQSE
ncbi:acyltransferase family protein [Polyangium mundeleinium]|uniref:Acyltransferase n=1 Tax=Polyangium mundeleinium TaxID=2995306 RepID=A0ABT5EF84_9BACT|nr:acyltransferase [Polyangium mundeleinium]MDC0740460.1 acyltransferase [Polyangium mundeleinium]